jgi:Ca-activated chloride channel family protein
MNGEDQALDLVALMGQLIEPAAPPAVSLVPQTAGWWVVAALVLLVLGYALWRVWRRRRDDAYRRAALIALNEAGGDQAMIATILRRTALAAYPRRQVAGLSGGEWVDFLTATGGFPSELGFALARAPYAPGATDDIRTAAEAWIRHHRRDR